MILKTIILWAPARPGCIKLDKNETNSKNSGDIGGSKINDKIANLSNSIKVKESFRIGFLTSETRLAFIQLRKAFSKALILYYVI